MSRWRFAERRRSRTVTVSWSEHRTQTI